MNDDDIDTGDEMVEEMGLDGGAFSVDDRQRFELLRRWHSDAAARAEAEKQKKQTKPTKRDP